MSSELVTRSTGYLLQSGDSMLLSTLVIIGELKNDAPDMNEFKFRNPFE